MAAPLREKNVSSHIFDDPGNKAEQFLDRAILTPAARTSFEILLNWSRARQANPNVEHDAKKAEKHISASPTDEYFTYHEVLAQLKHYEFQKRSKFERKIARFDRAGLAESRRKAACFAACEAIALSYWNNNQPIDSVYTTTRKPLYGASIVPIISFNRVGPYYLWDKDYAKVREYDEILRNGSPSPEYVAISHSWVRWQEADLDPVNIPGVEWPVPRNSKVDVTMLPQQLATLPWRYFWIDLLTIPQGNQLSLDEVMFNRKQWEINCVPQIFRKAFKAMVWLDDIPSWTALPLALDWLGLKYLSASTRSDVDPHQLSLSLSNAAIAAERPLELLEHDPTRQTMASDVWEPNGWFTSPCGLQEMIIRPDILLCNGNFEFLELSKGVPVALNDVAALLRVVSPTIKIHSSAPLSVQELYQLFDRVGMMHLLEIFGVTSVKLFDKIDGIAPTKYRGFPCIVPHDGESNPHKLPGTADPRRSEYDK